MDENVSFVKEKFADYYANKNNIESVDMATYCFKIGLPIEITNRAVSLYLSAKNKISNASDKSIIGACIYVACGLEGQNMRRTQKKVAKELGYKHPNMVNNAYRLLKKTGVC